MNSIFYLLLDNIFYLCYTTLNALTGSSRENSVCRKRAVDASPTREVLKSSPSGESEVVVALDVGFVKAQMSAHFLCEIRWYRVSTP